MQGYIGYFGLESWWLEELEPHERELICQRYSERGTSNSGQQLLEETRFSFVGMSPVQFLNGVAGCFRKDGERDFAYRVIDKAQALITSDTQILDVHFLMMTKIELTYRDVRSPDGIERCIAACREQIAIAPQAANAFQSEYAGPLVEHTGYKRLVMLLEGIGYYIECVRICEEALAAGWSGDWEKRAARCRARTNLVDGI
ncbi:MAG: hypothetical protein ABFC67_07570 [Mizugakiibacter sp.]|uniref:hypothetical protein n=1 Tax=Mizugakiibacter sp. TaxID=1972610 RepID=UPI0031C5BFC5|nr:hypothetical protein [Xanthomonadaceae bacterium]